MNAANFRFYAELNDFLPHGRRQRDVTYEFRLGPSVKDAIEAQGPPHTAVDLILVNGESVGFDRQLADGDRVSVYPVFESLEVAGLSRLRSIPLREPAFVADVHLGKLARYLRLLGFDTAWSSDATDDELAAAARDQNRIVLTRDRGLLKRRAVERGIFVRADDAVEQAVDIVSRLDLGRRIAPFGRCLRCNGLLQTVDKSAVEARLEPRTREFVDDFQQCDSCGRVYWPGSHHAALQQIIEDVQRRVGT